MTPRRSPIITARAWSVSMVRAARAKRCGPGSARRRPELVVFLDADVIEYHLGVRRPPDPATPRAARNPVSEGVLRAPPPQHADWRRAGQRARGAPNSFAPLPGLGEIRQPLAGETAGRRSAFDAITLEKAYGVEIALLIDIARQFGVRSLAQVDLGVRRHRNRPLEELRPMSMDVLRAALKRYSVHLPPQS